MTWLIGLVGVLIIVLGTLGVVRPDVLIGLVQEVWKTRRALGLAVGFRALFGIALILAAPSSRFPTALWVLGVLSLVTAGLAALLGYERVARFVRWWESRAPGFVRVWGAVAATFGAFLVWAVV